MFIRTYTLIYFSESLPPALLLGPARLLFLGESSYLHVYLRITIIRQARVHFLPKFDFLSQHYTIYSRPIVVRRFQEKLLKSHVLTTLPSNCLHGYLKMEKITQTAKT